MHSSQTKHQSQVPHSLPEVYDPAAIEPKWQERWQDLQLFQQTEVGANGRPDNSQDHGQEYSGDPLYLLFAFAYPSGSGLHVGHVESKTALDILARYYRMTGRQVFFPVGWDAFGLPAENYAIKTGVPPVETTKTAIDTFRQQIKRIGISYDWANELATCHPGYYRWTQWIFLELFKQGLAYQKAAPVNWCPSCQTVLANEQVVSGACERCGTEVIQKNMKQWFFKITQYRDELISGLDLVDWPEATKQQQLNWIGKNKGLAITFTHESSQTTMPVWTKFWETVFGVTFVVIAPEKFQEWQLLSHVPEAQKAQVVEYLEQVSHKTEEERQKGAKDKTGVDTGLTVLNPVTGESVPLWIADYVLINVGTGVVMGVPAHDERDFEFAKKFGLPIRQVVSYQDAELDQRVARGEVSHEGEGTLVNSGQFDGLSAWGEGKTQMAKWMIDQGMAEWQTTYKLRDWLISRQRYWGAPIPIVYDPEGQPHPVKAEHLPWMLPTDVEFKPTGESPLVNSQELKDRVTQLYGAGWTPEFDTMDTFVDSSWYFLRYVDSRNEAELARPDQLQRWLPVDFYMIGPEHIVLHLLYSRFFTKFLRDQGYLTFDEPFMKMRHQGMILGPDGRKMSKSKGNVINPDEIIEKFGADTLRVYEMFMGPIESDKPWDITAVAGVYRFLSRWFKVVQIELATVASASSDTTTDAATPAATAQNSTHTTSVRQKLHQTLAKLTDDLPKLKFNTAIAAVMELVNVWEPAQRQQGSVAAPLGVGLSLTEVMMAIKMMAPLAPFLSEELYAIGHSAVVASSKLVPPSKATKPPKPAETSEIVMPAAPSVHLSDWPQFDPELAQASLVILPIQVNGKVRAQLELPADQAADEAAVAAAAQALPELQTWLQDRMVKKIIFVPGKIVNLVVS